jgi:hypothetical protein
MSTSGLPVTYVSATPSICAVTGNIATLLGPGTCTLTATQVGTDDVNPAPTVSRSLTVTSIGVYVPLVTRS